MHLLFPPLQRARQVREANWENEGIQKTSNSSAACLIFCIHPLSSPLWSAAAQENSLFERQEAFRRWQLWVVWVVLSAALAPRRPRGPRSGRGSSARLSAALQGHTQQCQGQLCHCTAWCLPQQGSTPSTAHGECHTSPWIWKLAQICLRICLRKLETLKAWTPLTALTCLPVPQHALHRSHFISKKITMVSQFQLTWLFLTSSASFERSPLGK